MRELRGIPIVGRGVSSAMPGTMPLPALLSKEARGKLFLIPPDEPERGIVSSHYDRQGAPLATRATRESGRFFRGRR